MKIRFSIALLAAAVAVPSLARAEEFGLRIGLEAPMYTHNKLASPPNDSYSIGDTLQPSLTGLFSWKPDPLIALEAEFLEGFTSTGGTNYSRRGTFIGPGVRLQPTGFPLYVRASLPIHVEPSPVVMNLRGAAGLELSLVVLSLYLEGAVDTSLVGGSFTTPSGATTTSTDVGAFDITSVSVGTGVWFKF